MSSAGAKMDGEEWMVEGRGALMLLVLRMEGGRWDVSVVRRLRGVLVRVGKSFSDPAVRGRGPYTDCGLVRGEGGIYGRLGISET